MLVVNGFVAWWFGGLGVFIKVVVHASAVGSTMNRSFRKNDLYGLYDLYDPAHVASKSRICFIQHSSILPYGRSICIIYSRPCANLTAAGQEPDGLDHDLCDMRNGVAMTIRHAFWGSSSVEEARQSR